MRMRHVLLTLVFPLLLANGPFEAEPVQAEALDELRGGFVLPGGLDVSFIVHTETSVNGAVQLSTRLTDANGNGALSVRGPDGQANDVRITESDGTYRARLAGSELDVTHLAGRSLGAIVVNRADDVAVDTVGQVDIVLRNATAFNLGSAGLRAQDLALESTARLAGF